MRKLATTTLMIVLAAAIAAPPALAQQKQGPRTSRSDAQKREDAEVDKAYQNAIRGSRDSKPAAPVDPWGNVRSTSGTNDKR